VSGELERRVDSAVLDVRLALANPAVRGKRRELLNAELLALRLARVGVTCRGQRSYLRRLGLHPNRR
jgi:hypothetical protein